MGTLPQNLFLIASLSFFIFFFFLSSPFSFLSVFNTLLNSKMATFLTAITLSLATCFMSLFASASPLFGKSSRQSAKPEDPVLLQKKAKFEKMFKKKGCAKMGDAVCSCGGGRFCKVCDNKSCPDMTYPLCPSYCLMCNEKKCN